MMKKIVCGAAAVATLATSAAFGSTTAFAAKYGPLTYVVISSNKIMITDCDESAVNVTIPSKIGGKSVTEIGAGAFSDCSKLKTVNMPDTIQYIDNNAFQFCGKLEQVKLSKELRVIEPNAFRGCAKLKKVRLPKKLWSIGSRAFQYCSSLEEVVIPFDTDTVGTYAFNGCSSMMDLIVDGDETEMPDNAFPGRGMVICNIDNTKITYNHYDFMFGNATNTYSMSGPEYDFQIDVADAQLILRYYAEILAGNASAESDYDAWYLNRAIMDLNRDGEISVDDAQFALRYYTEVVVSGKSTSLVDYMYKEWF